MFMGTSVRDSSYMHVCVYIVDDVLSILSAINEIITELIAV